MTILGKIKKDLTREKDYENFLCRYGLYFLLFLLIMVLLSNLAIFFWLKGKANLTLNETTPIRIKTELYAKIKKNLTYIIFIFLDYKIFFKF